MAQIYEMNRHPEKMVLLIFVKPSVKNLLMTPSKINLFVMVSLIPEDGQRTVELFCEHQSDQLMGKRQP